MNHEKKKMKSIVVEEQEQEEGSESESETGFVDLDRDAICHVLMRVDMFTLGRAACVNKLWRKAAGDNRLWQLIFKLHNEVKRGEQKSETGFEDLNEDGFPIVLKLLHKLTSRRVNKLRVNKLRVNKLCCDVAECKRFSERVVAWPSIDGQRPPPLDFYSINPLVFSIQIGPWRN